MTFVNYQVGGVNRGRRVGEDPVGMLLSEMGWDARHGVEGGVRMRTFCVVSQHVYRVVQLSPRSLKG